MSLNTAPVTTAPTPFANYAAALLPFAILVSTGLQAVLKHPGDWTVLLPFAILVLGGILAVVTKLSPGAWAARAKVIITLVAAVIASLIPFVLPGGFDPSVDATIVVNAVLQTLAVQLGVDIRTDAQKPIDAREAVGVPSVTSVASHDRGINSLIDAPEHRAGD